MKSIKMTFIATLLIALLALTGSLMAVVHNYGETTDSGGSGVIEPVQNRHADPSPGTAASNLNDYTYQDEQVNIAPDSGIVKVLRTDEKININRFVTDLVEFKNANPRELRHAFRTITRMEGGDADVLQDKVKKEFFLHVVCPEFQLPYLKTAAEELDEEWIKVAEDGDGNLYYEAKFRPVEDINWISSFYRSGEGYFDLDLNNNALYYNDSPAVIGLQKWGLSQIDIPTNQVMLDVAVYEVDTQSDAKIGLDWIDWKNGPGRNLFEGVLSNIHENLYIDYHRNGVDLVDADTEWSREYNYFNYHAVATTEFIDFLQVKGKARQVMKKTLLAQSGHMVESMKVDRVVAIHPVHNSTPAADETVVRYPRVDQCRGVLDLPQAHQRWVNFVQSGNVGFMVGMLPFIGQESMELSVSLFADTLKGISGPGLPVFSSEMVNTRVRLWDNQPLVIAGVSKDATINRTAKVPFLGSLPVLGWLFGNEIATGREVDLIMVITPRFMIGAESDFEMPAEMETIMAQAEGEMMVEVPSNSYGFDQWLLDSSK